MTAPYSYHTLALEGGRAAHRALADRIAAETPTVAAAGGEVLGQFAPQLGWAGNEAAVLVRWAGSTAPFLVDGPPIIASRVRGLTPTARPAADNRPPAGGIYVHRWFAVGSASVAEFVDLSSQAWPDFESQFDTNIFGLFRAEQNQAEAAADEVSLLLITRYADHGVWEASRDPTTEAMQVFARRAALTRRTQAASTLLVGV